MGQLIMIKVQESFVLGNICHFSRLIALRHRHITLQLIHTMDVPSSLYTFSASAPITRGMVTRLVYRPVHAPNVATTPPTITKLFYPE